MAFLSLFNRTLDAITGTNSADVIDVRSAPSVPSVPATTLSGGNGNDIYYIDGELNVAGAPPDEIVELVGGGVDTVNVRMHQYRSGPANYGNMSFTLANNVENLNVSATNNSESFKYNFSLFGNSSANVITASTASSNNQFSIDGGAGNDRLTASIGDDILKGGSGTNVLIGGAGDDTYYVDGTDTIVELVDGGEDVVNSTRAFTLSANVENLNLIQLEGSMVGLNGTGNALGNVIEGTDLSNVLNGGSNGNDTLNGHAGNDVLSGGNESDLAGGDSIDGGTGNDKLDGGSGADSLIGGTGADTLLGGAGNDSLDAGVDADIDSLDGGAGNDTFLNIGATDIVRDTGVGGIDSAYFAQNKEAGYILGLGIERGYLVDGVIAGMTGNNLANMLIGNALSNNLEGGNGNDTLDGGVGADILVGGAGDDSYYLDTEGDDAIEEIGNGKDTVYFQYLTNDITTIDDAIENATLTEFAGTSTINGNAANNLLIGNSYANVLRGSDGKDTLDGGAGNDILNGGNGDDVYYVDSEEDVVQESGAVGSGIDLVFSTAEDFTLTANVENGTIAANNGFGISTLYGNNLNNILLGNGLDNDLHGNGGRDTMTGGKGDDYYFVGTVTNNVINEKANEGTLDKVIASGTFSIAAIANVEGLQFTLGFSEAANLTGNALANTITGNGAANSLIGGAGNDTLLGGGGTDTLIGGTGNDEFYVDSLDDVITEAVNGGTDTVYFEFFRGTHTLAANIENGTLTEAAGTSSIEADFEAKVANKLTGNSFANTLEGGAGNDTLNGGTGADNLKGGLGDDTFYLDNVGEVVEDYLAVDGFPIPIYINAGIDTIYYSINADITALAESKAFIENIVLVEGAGELSALGNSLNNKITGNANANTINGGTGRDTLIGGAGDDWYRIDDGIDTVVEKANEGIDTYVTINSEIKTYSIAAFANVENLNVSIVGDNNIDVYTAIGNAGNNEIKGALGFRNSISGGAGNDTLLGGNLVDTFSGGAGNDYYRVSSAAGEVTDVIDIVIEAANGGTDTINFDDYNLFGDILVNVSIATNVENAEITESGLTANFIGNASNNRLTGADGNDTLNGGAGNDTLVGNAGNDSLNGGAGNDTYFYESGDTINESIAGAAGGKDTIVSTGINIDLSIAAFTNIENITLQGNFNGLLARGTAVANSIVGGNGSDYLEGMAGNDTLIGGEGNDTFFGGGDFLASALGVDSMVGGIGDDHYMVDVAGDKVIELTNGGIFDTVASYVTYKLGANVEHLILKNKRGDSDSNLNINGTGNASNNIIQGGDGNNVINGGAGNDTIFGGFGTDSITGGTGNDTFVLNSVGVEKILDFTLGQDKLTLNATGFIYSDDFLRAEENFSAFSGLTFEGINNSLTASLFSVGELVDGSASNYIQYDIKTGNLYYDANLAVAGGAVLIAEFKDGTAIFATDIFEYAIPLPT